MASELKVDKFTGVTTAGSISVTGEGNSTTTNLQQGLAKAWTNILYTSAAPGIQDSFNASSVADTTTGEYTVTLSNNMANSNYVCVDLDRHRRRRIQFFTHPGAYFRGGRGTRA